MPINWHGSAEEVAYVVNDSQAAVVVAHADLLHHVRHALPSSVTVLGVTTPPSIAERFEIDAALTTLPSDVAEWSTWRDGFEEIADALRRRPLDDDLHLGDDRATPRACDASREPMTGPSRSTT